MNVFFSKEKNDSLKKILYLCEVKTNTSEVKHSLNCKLR